MKRNKSLIILIFLTFLLNGACRETSINHKIDFIDFGHVGMIPSEQYIFQPFKEIENDSLNINKYDISIILRYTDKCSLKFLPLQIEASSYNYDSIYNYKLEAILFEDDTTFTSNKNYGLYETEILLLVAETYDEGLNLAISTYEKDTKGIISLGLNCSPTK